MDEQELIETGTWELYEQGRNYCRMINMYSETDRNYRFYNDDQWDGLKIKGIEPVQLNFIKPVVKYKISVIHSNLYAVNYSSQNFENKDFRKNAEKICEMLNKRASRIWEKDNLDLKARQITKDSGINAEGIMYVTYSRENDEVVNEVIKKNDIYFGNENDSDIQRQPYIIIKQRRPVLEVMKMARAEGISEEKIKQILGDNDTSEESGDYSKLEKDNNCTILTKFYKKDGKVYYSKATRYVDIVKDVNSELTLYPIAHFIWEELEGSARGIGEVKYLIPNQIEVNKTIMRRLLVAKNTAYPQKVVNITKVQNPSAVDSVGGVIKVKDMSVDDVSKVFTNIPPAQMSTDVEKIQNELISISRDLAGAGEAASGDIDPESASGRAILAVQQASQQPLSEQLVSFKTFLEDLARIWLDMITTYAEDKITLEEEEEDPNTGETIITPIEVPKESLEALQASVKVDITPKGAYDKYAQEISMENLLKNGLFNAQRLQELKMYTMTLDDDSVMPKQKLEEVIEYQEEEQRRIAEINAQAQMMMQNADKFLNADVDEQADLMNDASQMGEQAPEEEAPVEENMDEEAE